MYVFIINPIAGNGRAKRHFATIKKSKLYQDIKSEYYITKYKGHAEEITEQILTKKEYQVATIIVVGGDGTLNEVINGLENYSIPVSFIPGGSGNDFARGCKITGSPLEILQQTINGNNTIPYWLGNYQADEELTRHFINNIGFGFDAEIAKAANDSKYKKIFNFLRIGRLSYVIALIQVLFQFKPFDVILNYDNNTYSIKDCWMVTISNHPFYGGGMKVIPNAKIQPTIFPLMIIHSISRWKILGLFMTVFSGSHVGFKEVEIIEAKKLSIHSEEKLTYQVDGEVSTCYFSEITKQSKITYIQGTKGLDSNRMQA